KMDAGARHFDFRSGRSQSRIADPDQMNPANCRADGCKDAESRTPRRQSPPRGASADPDAGARRGRLVVEVALVIAGNPLERRFFAVGLEDAAEAEDAVLRYPSLMIDDRRIARRPLSLTRS